MQKANKFFILSGVADHILADFRNVGAVSLFNFRHQDDKAPNRLQIQVTRSGADFILSYDAEYNGQTITQAVSKPIPGVMVQEFIARIANDAIPLEGTV